MITDIYYLGLKIETIEKLRNHHISIIRCSSFYDYSLSPEGATHPAKLDDNIVQFNNPV
jgi:hypothetical protein